MEFGAGVVKFVDEREKHRIIAAAAQRMTEMAAYTNAFSWAVLYGCRSDAAADYGTAAQAGARRVIDARAQACPW